MTEHDNLSEAVVTVRRIVDVAQAIVLMARNLTTYVPRLDYRYGEPEAVYTLKEELVKLEAIERSLIAVEHRVVP